MENIFDKSYKYLAYRTDLKHPERLISLFFNILLLCLGIKNISIERYFIGVLDILIVLLLTITDILFYKLILKEKKKREEFEQLIKELEEKFKER